MTWLRRWWEGVFGRRVVAVGPPVHRVVCDWGNVRAVATVPDFSQRAGVAAAVAEFLRGDRTVLVIPAGVTVELYEMRAPAPVPSLVPPTAGELGP